MNTFAPLAPGALGMVLVGSSVTVSRSLVHAPLFATQAVRYAAAALLLLAFARAARVPILRPRGREWLWLAGIAATGLALFNVAVVRGVAHAEPAVIAVAVASAPVLLGVLGPLLEGRRPSRRILVAAVVVVAGAVLVEGRGVPTPPGWPGPRWRWPARPRSPCSPYPYCGATVRGASPSTQYGWGP